MKYKHLNVTVGTTGNKGIITTKNRLKTLNIDMTYHYQAICGT